MTITKIYILLDYFCFPVEGFTADGVFVRDDEIEEFQTHPELYEKFLHLQEWYNSGYKGIFEPEKHPYYFGSKEELDAFLKEWHETVDEFLRLANGKYEIEYLFEDFKSVLSKHA